jgi:hypothetical protein
VVAAFFLINIHIYTYIYAGLRISSIQIYAFRDFDYENVHLLKRDFNQLIISAML